MARIVVFDSGLGSLSVIGPIQKRVRAEVVYFADQENYPYGTKTTGELKRIIGNTIRMLEERFKPDVIVVASNTPSLLLKPDSGKILGVYPPLKEAAGLTRTGKVAVLATRAVVKSRRLQEYIRHQLPSKIKVIRVNASGLVDLVESGKFISDKGLCKKLIKKDLQIIEKEGADVATLSSTHLPFLLPMLREVFPNLTFLDPADSVADKLAMALKNKRSKKNRLKIFASGNTGSLQKKLEKLGIKNKVYRL